MRHCSVHSVVARCSLCFIILGYALGCAKDSTPQQPQLFVDRDTVTFGGSVYIGAIPQDSIEIRNNGLDDLIISSTTLTNDGNAFTNVGPNSTVLKGKEHTFVTFYFRPTQARQYTGTFTIASNAQNTPNKVITLTATGVTPPP